MISGDLRNVDPMHWSQRRIIIPFHGRLSGSTKVSVPVYALLAIWDSSRSNDEEITLVLSATMRTDGLQCKSIHTP